MSVTLPHDAMIHETRAADAPGGGGHGYFPGGVYVYEKNFTAPADWADKTVSLLFEGVYKTSTVSINGKEAGGQPYGYTPFTVCLDGLLNVGGENTVTVTADNSQLPNSRWYSGSGIYRPVHLLVGEKAHIAWQGVKITTLSINPAKIRVETSAVNSTTEGEIVVEILDGGAGAAGTAAVAGAACIASGTGAASVATGAGAACIASGVGAACIASGMGAACELEIPNAKLWSDETPNLYTCCVTLKENGRNVDEVTERFGIREITWSPKGLFINGRETLLRGGCVHHDNGVPGAGEVGTGQGDDASLPPAVLSSLF